MNFFNLFLHTSLQKLRQSDPNIDWSWKRNSNQLINTIEQNFINSKLVVPLIGDIIRIGVKIKEGNKERIQYYEGTVIAIRNSGINLSITVRRISLGLGTERVFFLYSPKIDSIKIKQHSKVRRAKLYFLRQRIGKAVRLKQKF